MLFSENERAIIQCNRCPVRLDVGPRRAFENRGQMPSMWRKLGGDEHLCPSCAQIYGPRFSRSHGRIVQPR